MPFGKSHALQFQLDDEKKDQRLRRGAKIKGRPTTEPVSLEDDGAPTTGAATEVELPPELEKDGSAIIDVPGDEAQHLEELADGSVLVREDDGAEAQENDDFLQNLTEVVPDDVLTRVGQELLEDIRRDIEARKERDEQYAEGLKRTGLGKEAPGGADFEGASRVVHPLITEGCVDFSSRVMKEIFPAKGPVKMQIIGESTRKKIEKAERKKQYMNWQCTKQIVEMRGVVEQTLTQVPLGGSQFIKVWRDPQLKRARTEFVPIDEMVLPYSATSYYTAERRAHQLKITRNQYQSRVESGFYRDVGGEPSAFVDKTAAQIATEKIEGKTDDLAYNKDGLRLLYEIDVLLQLEGDPLTKGKAEGEDDHAMAPYIVVLDDTTGKIAAIYRNWDEDDEEKFERLDWIVEFKFFPWRGAYGIGLIHIAGSLSAAATGALRALLDSAQAANLPAALALKGARMSGQSIKANPTEITQIEGPTGVDDIRKLAMPFPFPGPNATLFSLLEYCVQAGKSVINTAEERIADAGSNSPVGTTLALIEQGSITFSSVHSRMHEAMGKLLAIIHRIDAKYLSDKETVEELGELTVSREDFAGPMDVCPVSDPNIFSEAQRYAQLQEVFKLYGLAPQAFKLNVLVERALQLLNYPQYEEVLALPMEPQELMPIEENVGAGRPEVQLQAYEGQDHMAHMEAHLSFAMSPIFCANPLMAIPALPKLLEHCKQHLLMLYEQHTKAAAKAVEFQSMGKISGEKSQLQGVVHADQQLAQMLGERVMPLMEKAQQLVQQFMPPPQPQDPRGATQIALQDMKGKQKKEELQLEGQQRQQELAFDAQKEQAAEAAAATRHTEEMGIATQNAELALQSEREAQAAEREAHALDARVRVLLGEMASAQKSEAEATRKEIAELNSVTAQIVAILNKVLDEKPMASENSGAVNTAVKQAGSSVASKVDDAIDAVTKLTGAAPSPSEGE